MTAGFEPLSAAQLARRYSSGEDTPSATCERALAAARAADLADPPLRACIRLLDEDAREAARAASQRWREGRPLSRLDGVPLVVKDCLDVKGHPSTNGMPSESEPARSDGHAVALLRAAGAVIVAKANLHQLAGGLTGFNPHHGTARNPYDTARVCGGSSSGSAAAVAAGIVPLALGTDAGGSVRCPAALTGLVGMKPTLGRISRTGLPLRCESLDTIGLLAHDCADAALLLATIAPGPDPADPDTAATPHLLSDAATDEVRRPIDGLRIGVDPGLYTDPLVDPALGAQVEAALAELARQGAELVEIKLPDLELALQLGYVILSHEGTSVLSSLAPDAHPRLGAEMQRLMASTAQSFAPGYADAQRLRRQLIHRYSEVFAPDACDLIALPTTHCLAPRLRDVEPSPDDLLARRLQSHLMLASVTGLPALSVPCGYASELPVGLQLIGRPWAELTLLRAGAALERAGASPRRRPAIWFGP